MPMPMVKLRDETWTELHAKAIDVSRGYPDEVTVIIYTPSPSPARDIKIVMLYDSIVEAQAAAKRNLQFGRHAVIARAGHVVEDTRNV